jgi:predicted flap endonuclease-1-like 5' DNA nuclease
MTYLIGQLGVFLLTAFALGAAVGWSTSGPATPLVNRLSGLPRGLVLIVALAAVGAFALAIAKAIPDGPGFWWDSALLMLGAYLLGCMTGALARGVFGTESGAAGRQTVQHATATAAPPRRAALLAVPCPIPADGPAAAMRLPPGVAVAQSPASTAHDDDPDMMPVKPTGRDAPLSTGADDLKRIRGIGRVNEAKLNALGIFHFAQIAAWTPAEVKWMNQFFAFPGRIQREDWVGQAAILATGATTAFAARVDAGEVETSAPRRA